MPDQGRRGPGRPRKWASEAERKRAYRARRATELAEPHRLRDDARQAREAATAARTEAETARRAKRAEQRALTAERRLSKLLDQLRTAQAETRRARTARDEARGQLRRKLGTVNDAKLLRDDPDALLATVAKAERLIEWYRRRLKQLERELWRARQPGGNR
ncbi:MAG TPA: hypothetical protein VF942_07195 [Acidimicrobiales bacterium]